MAFSRLFSRLLGVGKSVQLIVARGVNQCVTPRAALIDKFDRRDVLAVEMQPMLKAVRWRRSHDLCAVRNR